MSSESSKNIKAFYTDELKVVKDFATKLMKMNFESGTDLWDFELALAKYQVDLQQRRLIEKENRETLKREIAGVTAIKEWDWLIVVQLKQEQLRIHDQKILIISYLHRLSQIIGDSLAWFLLKGDEQKLAPLTENQPNRTTPSGHGFDGMVKAAELFNANGAGFPLLHDITSWLRIGDITFISYDKPLLTVEVKTNLLNVNDNVATGEIQVFTVIEKDDTTDLRKVVHSTTNPNTSEKSLLPTRQLDERLQRQLRRIANSHIKQKAVSGEANITIDGDEFYALRHEGKSEDLYNIAKVQAIIQSAKETGYASKVVDDSFLYIAIYAKSPLTYPWEEEKSDPEFLRRMITEVKESSIWYEDPNQNSLYFNIAAPYVEEQTTPLDVIPYLCYSLTVQERIDILQGSLQIWVFINLGRIANKLKELGFDARIPANSIEFKEKFIPAKKHYDKYGLEMDCATFFSQFGAKFIHNFLSMDGFVSLVLQMESFMEVQVQEIATKSK